MQTATDSPAGNDAAGALTVSVVVCTRDRAQRLADALPAVTASMHPADELIVVDSASLDLEVAVVAERSGARLLRAARPGLGHARNIGWRAARRPIIAFTDDDCRPLGDWPARLAAGFADSSIGMVYGRVVAAGAGAPVSVHDSHTGYRIDTLSAGSVDRLGHGANFAIRREVLDELDGFADDLGAGSRLRAGEDIDLAVRVLAKGWAIAYLPDATVHHDQWRGRLAGVRIMYGYGMGAGAVARRRRAECPQLLRHELIDRGLRQSWRDLRNGYQYGAAACLARAAGTVVGGLRGLGTP